MRQAVRLALVGAALAAAASAWAQPAPVEPIDDLQWLFIEDTVALINPPSPAAAERARALMAQANQARAKGDNSAMRRALAEARVLLANGSWSPEAAFTASLAIRPHHSVADAARPVTVEIGQRFAAAAPGAGPLKIEVGLRRWEARPKAPRPVDWRAAKQTLGADLLDQPLLIDVPLNGVADGSYELVVRASRGRSDFGTTARRLFVAAELDRDLAEIDRRVRGVELSDAVKASVLYPGDLVRTLNDRTREVRDVAMRPLLDRALALLAEAEAGRDGLTRARGDQERHYWLDVAGRYEPYRIVIPDDWDGRTKLPLVVMLHGSNGDHHSTLASGKAAALAKARGWALLSPMGYTPNGGWGNHLRVMLANGTAPEPRPSTIAGVVLPKDGVDPEPASEDVLRTLERVRAEYPIDPARIYLMGNSMGGEGTWHLAAQHPELWAAVAPGAGAIEPAVYPYRSLGRLPVLAVHGDKDDIISFDASRTMVERLQQAGGNARLLAIPGGGHSAMSDVLDQIFDFFAMHRRKPGTGRAR